MSFLTPGLVCLLLCWLAEVVPLQQNIHNWDLMSYDSAYLQALLVCLVVAVFGEEEGLEEDVEEVLKLPDFMIGHFKVRKVSDTTCFELR